MESFEDEMKIRLLKSGDPDTFTNENPLWVVSGRSGVSGAVVLGHSVLAALRTLLDGFYLHSLHVNFLASSESNDSIMYHVDRVKDGRQFATRVVRCTENGNTLALVVMGFTRVTDVGEPTLNYAVPMPPGVEGPSLSKLDDFKQFRTKTGGAIEGQRLPIILGDKRNPESSKTRQWVRTLGVVSATRQAEVSQCAIPYLSDNYILDTPPRLFGLKLGYGINDEVVGSTPIFFGALGDTDLKAMATLNHTIHVHRPSEVHAGEWMFVEIDSDVANNRRGVAHSRFFSKDGKLLASCTQEGYYQLKDRVNTTPFVERSIL